MDKLTTFVLGLFLATLWWAAWTIFAPPACAQIHPHHSDDHFYSKWNRPDLRKTDGSRYYSCCNRQDCFAVKELRPLPNGDWEVLDQDGTTWVRFPANKIEHNTPDPEESPDGMTHACIIPSTKVPLCLVLGGQG